MGELNLEPCPFCGGEARMVEVPTPGIGTRCRVGCDDPLCPVAPAILGSKGTPEEAAAAWNRRAGRICRNEATEPGFIFECSECDERHGYDDEPAYCKGCGAKVVE